MRTVGSMLLISFVWLVEMMNSILSKDIILPEVARGDRLSYPLLDLLSIDRIPKTAFTEDLSLWSEDSSVTRLALIPFNCSHFSAFKLPDESEGPKDKFLTSGLCWKEGEHSISFITQITSVTDDVMGPGLEFGLQIKLDSFNDLLQYFVIDSDSAVLLYQSGRESQSPENFVFTVVSLSLKTGNVLSSKKIKIKESWRGKRVWTRLFQSKGSVLLFASLSGEDSDGQLLVTDVSSDASPVNFIDLSQIIGEAFSFQNLELISAESIEESVFGLLFFNPSHQSSPITSSSLLKLTKDKEGNYQYASKRDTDPFYYHFYEVYKSPQQTVIHGYNTSTVLVDIVDLTVGQDETLLRKKVTSVVVPELLNKFSNIRTLGPLTSILIRSGEESQINLVVHFTKEVLTSPSYSWIPWNEYVVFSTGTSYVTIYETHIRLNRRNKKPSLFTDTSYIKEDSINSKLILIEEKEGKDTSTAFATLIVPSITENTNMASLNPNPPPIKQQTGQKTSIVDLIERGIEGLVIKAEIEGGTLTRNNFQWLNVSKLISMSSMPPGTILKIVDENTLFRIIGNTITIFVYHPFEGVLDSTNYTVPFEVDWLLGYSTLGEKVLVAVNSRASVGLVSIVQMCLTSKGFSIKTFPMEAPYLAAFTLIENSFYYLVGSRDSGVLKVYRRTGSQVEFEDLTENLTPQSFSNYVTNNTDICPIEVSFFFEKGIVGVDVVSVCTSLQSLMSVQFMKTGPSVYVYYIDDEQSMLDGCIFRDYMYFVDRDSLVVSVAYRKNLRKRYEIDLKNLGYSTIFWFDCNEKHQLMFIPVAKPNSSTTDLILMDGSRNQTLLHQRASYLGSTSKHITTLRGISGKFTVFFSVGEAEGTYSFYRYYYDMRPTFTLNLDKQVDSVQVKVPGLSGEVPPVTWKFDTVEDPAKLTVQNIQEKQIKPQKGNYLLSKLFKITGVYCQLRIKTTGQPQNSYIVQPRMTLTSSNDIPLIRTFDNDKILFTVNDFVSDSAEAPPLLAQDDVGIYMVHLSQQNNGSIESEFKKINISSGICTDYAIDGGLKYVMAFNYSLSTVYRIVGREYTNISHRTLGVQDRLVIVKTCRMVMHDIDHIGIVSILTNGSLYRFRSIMPIHNDGYMIEEDNGRCVVMQ